MIDMICGCGRDGKYVKNIGGEEVFMCNKRKRCPPYKEIEAALDWYIMAFNKIKQVSRDEPTL